MQVIDSVLQLFREQVGVLEIEAGKTQHKHTQRTLDDPKPNDEYENIKVTPFKV
jgi:hypothetical protein